ncbi:unnamed protein product [Arctogadus glacialis]
MPRRTPGRLRLKPYGYYRTGYGGGQDPAAPSLQGEVQAWRGFPEEGGGFGGGGGGLGEEEVEEEEEEEEVAGGTLGRVRAEKNSSAVIQCTPGV